MPAEPTTRGAARSTRVAAALLAALAALLLAAPPAGAAVPNFKGASADGSVVFFDTTEKLAEGDTDSKRDVYLRSFDAEAGDYVTREVSTGPDGGNDAYDALFEKASADGTRVFFSTDERLTAEDTDRSTDIYMREPASGTTTLVSRGTSGCAPGCGNGEMDSHFAGASADGSEVFFVTDEKLSAADTDSRFDVYVRTLGLEPATGLVSAGTSGCAPACGNGDFDATFWRVSGDGSHAFFTTAEKLSEADLDTTADIYARNLAGAGTTTLVSRGEEACAPGCGNSGEVPVFRASSASGNRVFFTTAEKLVEADEDEVTDVYARDLPGGPTTLISGGEPTAQTANFDAASPDGNHVFFSTAEQLVPEDEDSANDIYEWSGGSFALVTSAECSSACGATFDAASEDAEEVVFSTAEPLAGADTDSSDDIYRQHVGGGEPVLVSRAGAGCGGCGNDAADASFNRASADASQIVFSTAETLTVDDGDGEDDIYARDVEGEETSLVTTSPSYCPFKAGQGNCGATYVGASQDGTRVFFTSVERFTLDDGDDETDVYERFLGSGGPTTRLVSTGNNPNLELGPAPPTLDETDPVSPGSSTAPRIIGGAEPETSIKLYTQAGCSGEVKKAGTAAELSGAGIQVSVVSGSTTTFWATASDENGDTSACSNSLVYEHDVPAPSGGGGGGGGGSSAGSGPVAVAPAVPAGPAHVVPHTRITFAPASKTRARRPVFRFADVTGQGGTHFRCKLDRQRWRHCGSPVRPRKKLGRGRHVFAVRAVNAVGVWEPRPVRRRFKVVARGGHRLGHRHRRRAR